MGLKTYCEFIAESIDTGLYTYRKLNSHSAEFMDAWMRENRIPNPILPTELHCTVVCSEVAIESYEPDLESVMLNPATYRIDILNAVLVVRFKSDPLEEQWQRAMNMGGKSTYPTFIPHVSLSYKVPENYDYSELKPPPTFLVLEKEQVKPLVNEWTAFKNISEYTIGDMTLGGGPGIYVPQHSLNVPREEMPQISDANKMAFVDWLEGKGIDVQYINIPAAMLRSVQNGIDLKKVENLASSLPDKALNKPLIISKDNYILDGHHRWLAVLNRDPHYKLQAYRVNLPIEDLLKTSRNYDQAFFAKHK